MGMGVAANYIPGSAEEPPKTKEGFNVWYIQGGTGFVGMPPNGDPAETLGRLETMRMCLRGNHNYDITKIPKPAGGDSDNSNDDDDQKDKKKKKKKAKAKAVEETDESDEEIPKPPEPPTKPKKLVCNVCHGDKKKETRRIKGEGTIC